MLQNFEIGKAVANYEVNDLLSHGIGELGADLHAFDGTCEVSERLFDFDPFSVSTLSHRASAMTFRLILPDGEMPLTRPLVSQMFDHYLFDALSISPHSASWARHPFRRTAFFLNDSWQWFDRFSEHGSVPLNKSVPFNNNFHCQNISSIAIKIIKKNWVLMRSLKFTT